jgi:AcrR family transcriptional regulator
MPRRANAEPLTEQRLLTAALALVDERGLGSLSMRKLGAALGVDPMAVYYYFPNKQALLRRLTGDVFQRMRDVDRSGAWQRRVQTWARTYRRLALEHPNLVIEIVANTDAVMVAVPIANEALEAALRASGLDAEAVEMAVYLIVDYVNGLVLGEVAMRQREEESASFEFALSVIISGLESRLRESGAPPVGSL